MFNYSLMDKIKLIDCYTKDHGPVYMTGTQALVRLLLEQARLDREQGINSRGLVSGYPGSVSYTHLTLPTILRV